MWSERAISETIFNKLKSLQARGTVKYDLNKRRLVPSLQSTLATPWAFFGCSVATRNCFLWHKIMFREFSFVPSFCRFRCYKIVAHPRTVLELIRVYHFGNALPFFSGDLVVPPGKAGLDRRSYTNDAYSAFWYAQGLSHAKNLYCKIHTAMIKAGLEGVASTLVIKRSCTEFELQYGPTTGPYWKEASVEDQLLEDRLNDIFYVEPDDGAAQPNWHINALIEDWLDYARAHGDRTGDTHFGIINNGPITYHEGILSTKEEKQ